VHLEKALPGDLGGAFFSKIYQKINLSFSCQLFQRLLKAARNVSQFAGGHERYKTVIWPLFPAKRAMICSMDL